MNREIKRLEGVGEGVVAGKRLLEQQYDKQKLEAAFRAQRQGLLLHGLSESQIEDILKTRKLLQFLTVYAPEHEHHDEGCTEEHLFHIQSLNVRTGQQVEAGQAMAMLADHCSLYLEGRAFESDVAALRKASSENWKLSARMASGSDTSDELKNLELLYVADHIEPETRAIAFYVRLPNEISNRREIAGEAKFLHWKYRPGQRMEISIPIERWKQKIVLPVAAVVEDGIESYVFQQNGKKFVRRPVHVEYRDRSNVVVANDGSIFPGDVVVARGAYEMQIALKNKAGGAIDPHAGHNH
ncbi:MAG: efflux RND transporter periplasmic adaptor subunit [Pirellulales bacterium]